MFMKINLLGIFIVCLCIFCSNNCMFNKIAIGTCGCIIGRIGYVSYNYTQNKNKKTHYSRVYLGTKNVYLQTFDDLICDACKKIDAKISNR